MHFYLQFSSVFRTTGCSCGTSDTFYYEIEAYILEWHINPKYYIPIVERVQANLFGRCEYPE